MLLVLSAVFVVLVRACRARLVVLLVVLALYFINGLFREITLYAYTVAVVCVVVIVYYSQRVTVVCLEVAAAVYTVIADAVIKVLVIVYLCCAVA